MYYDLGVNLKIAPLSRVLNFVFYSSMYRSGVGLSGCKQHMYYTQVTDSMRTGPGGGCPEEGELIEIAEINVKDAMNFAFDDSKPKPVGVIAAIMWYIERKNKS